MAAEKRSSIANLCSETQDLTPPELGSENMVSYHRTLETLTISLSSSNTNRPPSYPPHPNPPSSLTSGPTSQPHPRSPLQPPKTTSPCALRDLLLKLVTLIGAPQVLSALIPLAAAQHPNPSSLTTSAQSSTLSPQWHNVDVPHHPHPRHHHNQHHLRP